MFNNPFKKKEAGFKLDDYSVPSMSEVNNSSNATTGLSTNTPPNFDSNASLSSVSNNTSSFDSGFDTGPSSMYSQSMGESGIIPSQSQYDDGSGDVKMGIVKEKIEIIGAKMELLDSKMTNIEQKLDFIYNVLMHEISDDTKRKVSTQNMMNSARNR